MILYKFFIETIYKFFLCLLFVEINISSEALFGYSCDISVVYQWYITRTTIYCFQICVNIFMNLSLFTY